MENNYKEYLESFAWKAMKQVKLQEQPNCECCGESATSVHHLSYERRWSEREDDIISICERCHHECHFVNGYQIKNDEETLRKRFEEVRDEFWENLISDEYFSEINEWNKLRVLYKWDSKYWWYRTDWKNIYHVELFQRWYEIIEVKYDIDLKSLHFFNEYYFTWNSGWYNNMLFFKEFTTSSVCHIWKYQENFDHNLINLHTFKCSKKDPTIAMDKNYIYSTLLPIYKHEWLNIDIDSFEYIDNTIFYSKDKYYIYYDINNFGTNKKMIADFDSFQVIDNIYAKDKNSVYCYWDKIEWLDSKTFEKIGDNKYKDKYNLYDREWNIIR